MLRAGVLILVISWIPLLIAGFVFGMDNPIGFGLLAWGGSALGLLLIGIGVVGQDIGLAHAAGEPTQHVIDRDAQAAHAGSPAALAWLDRDSRQVGHVPQPRKTKNMIPQSSWPSGPSRFQGV